MRAFFPSHNAPPFEERKERLGRTRETKLFRLISSVEISHRRQVRDSACAGEHSFAPFERKLKWQIISLGLQPKRLIIPAAVQSKPCAELSIQAVARCVSPSGNSRGPQVSASTWKWQCCAANGAFGVRSIAGNQGFYNCMQMIWPLIFIIQIPKSSEANFPCQAGTFGSTGMQAPAMTKGFCASSSYLRREDPPLHPSPSRLPRWSCQRMPCALLQGAESWGWPPCPQSLISTVTGEVRPPSTHRQPLVQSHSPAINKKPHLHKLTGTQWLCPSHLSRTPHTHRLTRTYSVAHSPSFFFLFFSFFFFKRMQSSITAEVIRICYYRRREFEGCTQFSEHSLLMWRIKCDVNQPSQQLQTRHKVLSFLIGQYVSTQDPAYYHNTRDTFHFIMWLINLAL